MALNIQPVAEKLLAPYCLVIITSTSALNDSAISALLRDWTSSQYDQSASWEEIAKRNNLLLKGETGTPFTVSEVYEGTARWVTIFKRGSEHLELSIGLRPQKGNPGHSEVAKDAETIVPRLAKTARRRWLWQTMSMTSEIMINRNYSGIQLSMPPSFREVLITPDVLKSLSAIGVAVVGGVVTALKTTGFSNIVVTLRGVWLPALITFVLAYLVLALLHWSTTRRELKWVLGKASK
ncbi:MAG: hypothetical protein ACT4OT_04055 [Acidobacteriota bacterium]